MTDSELLQQAGAGDHAAFNVIFRKYRSFVRGCAARYAWNVALRDDVEQEVWLDLLTRREMLRTADGELRPLLGTITDHKAIELQYRRARYRVLPSLDAPIHQDDGDELSVGDTVEAPARHPLDTLIAEEERRALRAAIAALPAADQRLLHLRYTESLRLETVAGIMGLSTNGVYLRLQRLRKHLAAALGRPFKGGHDRAYQSAIPRRSPVWAGRLFRRRLRRRIRRESRERT